MNEVKFKGHGHGGYRPNAGRPRTQAIVRDKDRVVVAGVWATAKLNDRHLVIEPEKGTGFTVSILEKVQPRSGKAPKKKDKKGRGGFRTGSGRPRVRFILRPDMDYALDGRPAKVSIEGRMVTITSQMKQKRFSTVK